MRMTVRQPSAVYPAPTRAESWWQVLHWAATNSLPFPSGDSWPQTGSAEQNRTIIMKGKRNFLDIFISPQRTGASARRRHWLRPNCVRQRCHGTHGNVQPIFYPGDGDVKRLYLYWWAWCGAAWHRLNVSLIHHSSMPICYGWNAEIIFVMHGSASLRSVAAR